MDFYKFRTKENKNGTTELYPGFIVGNSRCFFQVSKSTNDLFWHAVNVLRNFKVFNAALCLCAIKSFCRHLYFAHRIFFNPVL